VPAWTKNLGPKPPKPTMPTGANLLSQTLRDALQKTKDKATTTQGAVAATWLHAELDVLEKAHHELEAQLGKGGNAKHVAAIKQEMRSIDGQIASVERQITTNLHAQATAVKTAFTSKITAAKGGITSAMGLLKSTLDTQFQKQTQDYIDSALGPKFFQGTDAHGKQLLTPKEQRLLDMQKTDQRKSLTDAIRQAQEQLNSDLAGSGPGVTAAQNAYNAAVAAHQAAKDAGKDAATIQELQTSINNARSQLNDVANLGASPEQVKADREALDAANRQLAEYTLAAEAADERAQADYDYAQAVRRYQAERSELERQLNQQLDMFGKGLANGSANLSDLGNLLAGFGLSLTAGGGIVDDFATLSNAVTDLATVMFEKARALGGVGDQADAHAAAAAAARLVIPSGAPTLIPGTKINFADFYIASQMRNMEIPKLDVGGTVLETGLAVVHRGEDWSGVGANRRADGGSDGVHVHFDGPAFVGNEAELAVQIGRLLQTANRRGVKFAIA
jgi:hypothetical protein